MLHSDRLAQFTLPHLFMKTKRREKSETNAFITEMPSDYKFKPQKKLLFSILVLLKLTSKKYLMMKPHSHWKI